MAFQIRKFVVLFWVCFCLTMTEAHIEEFDWDVTTLARDGKSSLRIRPDPSDQSTIYEFTTKQVGVYDRTHFRVAFQWLRNLNENATAEYESVVFQFKLPQTGQFDDSTLEVIQVGKNWNQHNQGLNYNDYIKAILFNKTGFVSSLEDTSRYRVTVQQVSRYFSNVEVKLTFHLPGYEPVGEHRLWFRWAFYNPYLGYAGSCNPNLDCLGLSTIDGNDEPFFWSQFVNLLDYLQQEDLEWIINLYWIKTGITVFGLIGLIPQFIVSIYMFAFILDKSIKEVDEYIQFNSDETAQSTLTTYLWGFNLIHLLLNVIMFLLQPYPVLGPVGGLICALIGWTYIEVESQQADFNNYTGNTAYI